MIDSIRSKSQTAIRKVADIMSDLKPSKLNVLDIVPSSLEQDRH